MKVILIVDILELWEVYTFISGLKTVVKNWKCFLLRNFCILREFKTQLRTTVSLNIAVSFVNFNNCVECGY